jgi:hypothetical protein
MFSEAVYFFIVPGLRKNYHHNLHVTFGLLELLVPFCPKAHLKDAWKMIKKFKRRLSLTLQGKRGVTELAELAEHLTVEDTNSNGDIRENGNSGKFF